MMVIKPEAVVRSSFIIFCIPETLIQQEGNRTLFSNRFLAGFVESDAAIP
jgi:hypothetical protein